MCEEERIREIGTKERGKGDCTDMYVYMCVYIYIYCKVYIYNRSATYFIYVYIYNKRRGGRGERKMRA